MTEPSPGIRLLDPADRAEGGDPPAGFVRRRVDLPVRDEVLPIAVDVPDRPMRLAEAVPLVYAIDDRLIGMYLRHAEQAGREIYCKKGCGVCCTRYLIVYSPAEMYHVMDVIEQMPPGRQRPIRDWLEQMARLARQTGLIDRLTHAGPDEKPLDMIEKWWFEQGRTRCPFLQDDSCGIYAHRFVACREFYSHSGPEHCEHLQTIRMPTPLSAIDVLWQLEDRLTAAGGGVLTLPLMKLWADVRTEEARRTWPAVEIVDPLFAILAETARQAQRLTTGATVNPPADLSDPP